MYSTLLYAVHDQGSTLRQGQRGGLTFGEISNSTDQSVWRVLLAINKPRRKWVSLYVKLDLNSKSNQSNFRPLICGGSAHIETIHAAGDTETM